jgi:hypothetical protein
MEKKRGYIQISTFEMQGASKKEVYNFESFYKFIQRACTVF